MRKIIKILLLMILMISCNNIDIKANGEKLKHKIEVTNKGTKSEGITGYIYYKDYKFPNVFEIVQDNENSYKFKKSQVLWGEHGYIKSSEMKKIIEDNKKISKLDLDNGYYIGKSRLKNTPKNWIYVEWNENKAFIDLEKIDYVMKNNIFKNLQALDYLK